MNREDIDLVRRFRPAAPPEDPEVKDRAWARLEREIRSNRSRRFMPSLPRRTVMIGVAATVAAVTIVPMRMSGVFTGDPSPTRTVTATRTPGEAAAGVERPAVRSRPGPDRWVYARKLQAYALQGGNVVGEKAMLRGKVIVEEWWKFDGRQMAESVQGGTIYRKRILGPGERPRPGRVDPRFNGGSIGGPGIYNETPDKLYDYVATLPADPDAVLARVRKDYGDNGKDVTTFGVIAMLFRQNHLIPPQKAAALYGALVKIPNVRVNPNTADYAGRRGVGLFRDDGKPNPYMIILDPESHLYLGDTREALLRVAVVGGPGRPR